MKDLFSVQADAYAKYRPGYPAALIDYVLSFVRGRDAAWDCATGNGQAATLLSPYFREIQATDISDKQLAKAAQAPNIIYSRSPAENTNFKEDQFDLITVAQAYHWFDFPNFFREATRVGKPEAVVAVWGYGLVEVSDEKLDAAIRHFYSRIVGKYWDPERKYVEDSYQQIPFPFQELPSAGYRIELDWSREDFLGYLQTWSSVQHYIKANQHNPVDDFAARLPEIWIDSQIKFFSFPIFLRMGTIKK